MEIPVPLRTVLVADDEEDVRRLVRDALGVDGFASEAASDGREILTRYTSGAYGLLILDAGLSSTSGMEIVMRLRDRGDRIPIILLSGPMQEADRVEPFAFTYRVDVLRKPFSVRELRTAVTRALGAA